MSEQCRAYTFDRHERAVTLRGLQEMRRIFVRRSEPEGVAQCDAAIASLSHPVPAAQEFAETVRTLVVNANAPVSLEAIGYWFLRAAKEANINLKFSAAEMGLNLEEENA